MISPFKAVKSNLGRAIESNRNDGGACTHRRITDHTMVSPSARAQGAWQHGTQREGDATGKADLSTMRVTTDQYIEIGVRCLPINLRRVRYEY